MPEDMEKYRNIGGMDITLQRQHQYDLGYTITHDMNHHTPEELMRIAACYADLAALQMDGQTAMSAWGEESHPFWPSESEIPWNPEGTATGNAVKSGAFILASLDLQHALLMEGIRNVDD